MILTTTPNIEGFKIVDYIGIVTGTAYNTTYSHKGSKMSFKDMFNTSKYYENYAAGLESLKENAFQNLKDNAQKLEANAVVGIQLDIEPIANASTLLVSITGTAVKVE
jgi:uncharacterized protein YbjQ (UPF0145 family)